MPSQQAENDWDSEIHRAVDLHRADNNAAACAVLRSAIIQHPNIAALHCYLAGYLLLEGEAAAALPHAEEAVALAPTKPTPSRTLLLVLMELGQAVPAASEARRYLGGTQDPSEIEEWERILANAESHVTGNEHDA